MCLEGGLALSAFAFEKVTATSSAAGFTATNYQPISGNTIPAQRVILYVETAAIRVRYDGLGNPTTTDGIPVAVGGSLVVDGIENIKRLKFIAQSGSPVINAVFLR